MKMKYIGLLALLVLIVGFKIDSGKTERALGESKLQGTWMLISEKHGETGEMMMLQNGHTKKKLITGQHFSWVEYDKDGKLIALGGGTYHLTGSTYTENIEYSYPSGSSLLGASIPFECKIDGDNWLHSGYLQEREINGETGEYVVTNTEKLSEVWKRVK